MLPRPSISTCDGEGLRTLTKALHYPGDEMATRRALVFAAGVCNNKLLLKDLGSQEAAGWAEGRRAVDPAYKNPYWPND